MGFGEGGFIVCPTELYCEMEKIAGFGFEDGPINRVHNYYSSNYKMSDIAAAAIHQHIDNYDFERHLKLQDYFIKNILLLVIVCILSKGLLDSLSMLYSNLCIVLIPSMPSSCVALHGSFLLITRVTPSNSCNMFGLPIG